METVEKLGRRKRWMFKRFEWGNEPRMAITLTAVYPARSLAGGIIINQGGELDQVEEVSTHGYISLDVRDSRISYRYRLANMGNIDTSPLAQHCPSRIYLVTKVSIA